MATLIVFLDLVYTILKLTVRSLRSTNSIRSLLAPFVDVAKEEAHSNVGKTHPVLGKCIATIPAREYFRLVQQYGTEEVHSKEFLKFFQKEMPELAPNKV